MQKGKKRAKGKKKENNTKGKQAYLKFQILIFDSVNCIPCYKLFKISDETLLSYHIISVYLS